MKLKTKLSKLRHDGHITDAEYSIIINVLNKFSTQPCEDAISRQAVISEIDKYIEKAQSTGSRDDFISFQELVVKQLPPVTPKTDPCDDAISRAELLEDAYLLTDDEGITHEVVHADDIRYATPVTWSGWKSVTEEFPEPNTAVLLYVKYKSSGQWTYQLGMWNDSKQAWEDWRTPYRLEEEFDVIAWMELPEKYEEDNNEW